MRLASTHKSLRIHPERGRGFTTSSGSLTTTKKSFSCTHFLKKLILMTGISAHLRVNNSSSLLLIQNNPTILRNGEMEISWWCFIQNETKGELSLECWPSWWRSIMWSLRGESEGVEVGLKRELWRRCAVSISGGLPELIMSVWFWIPEFRLFTTWGPCHLSLPLHGVGKKFHQLTPLFADLKNNSVISPPPTHHSLQSVLRAFFNDTLISPFILNILMAKLELPLCTVFVVAHFIEYAGYPIFWNSCV